MPMYYFNLRNAELIEDTDGTELADDKAARAHAMNVVRELMFRSDGILERDWSDWSMAVHDQAGKELFSFPFSAAEGDGAKTT